MCKWIGNYNSVLKKNILYAELLPSSTDSNLKLTVNIIIIQ